MQGDHRIDEVKDTTYAGEKRKPAEFRLWRDSNPDLCNTRIVL